MLVMMMEYRQPVARSKAVRFLACRRDGLERRTIHGWRRRAAPGSALPAPPQPGRRDESEFGSYGQGLAPARVRSCLSGGDVLVQPVEDALAVDVLGRWLAMRIRALFLGKADQRSVGRELVV
jgi:hypothetical protein